MGKAKKIGIGVGLGILAFFIFILSLGFWLLGEEKEELRSLSQEELQEMAVQWAYDDILRNMEYYENKIMKSSILFTKKTEDIQPLPIIFIKVDDKK